MEKRITLTVEDINILRPMFGDKTINEIRRAAGLADVVGGDIGYMDWMRSNADILPPQLTIVANPFLDGHKE